jgi:drug/metabolite transporter (DMT)-like permease
MLITSSRHPFLQSPFMRPYILMLWSAMAFALMGACAHGAGEYCDWQLIALARSLLALIIAGALLIRQGDPLAIFRPWSLWVRSLAGSVSILCNFYALSHLPIADALTLTNMFPVWIAVLSWPVLGQFPERDVWLGVFCGVAGVAVMQQPYLAQGNLGTVAAVTGSLTSAVALIGLHRLRHIAPNAVVVHFSMVSIAVILGLLLLNPLEHVWSVQLTEEPVALWLLLGVGVSATAGQLMLTRAFAEGVPAKVSVVGLTQVGFAMVFDIVIWGRTLQWQTLLGMLLVIGPTIWLILRTGRTSVRSNASENLNPSEATTSTP